MNAPTGDNEAIMRARELEIEVARLNAELETLRGEGEPTDIAARFLTMAAATVDQAMDQARQEADELAAEVSAAAEARRDEATRIADEAEARTDALRAEAADAEGVVEQARTDAADITAAAEAEADALIAAERQRVADEIERLSSVREALEGERGALESYHDELKRRVQELAESMVAFMTTEPPLAAAGAIDELVAPELTPRDDGADEIDEIAAITSAGGADESLTEPVEIDDTVETPIAEVEVVDEIAADEDDAFEIAPVADVDAFESDVESDSDIEIETQIDSEIDSEIGSEIQVESDEESASSSPIDWSAGASSNAAVSETVEEAEEAAPETVSPFAAFQASSPADAEQDPQPEFEAAAEPVAEPVAETVNPFAETTNPFAETTNPFAEASVPAKPVEPSAFYDNASADEPPSFAEMMTAPPAPPVPPAPAEPSAEVESEANADEAAEFGGVPVVEREVTSAGLPTRRSRMGGLFGRGAAPAPAEESSTEESPAATTTGGLFGSHGARLIEQTSSEDLAAALAEESVEDERFRSFLDGDDDGDASREWLLRPEQS